MDRDKFEKSINNKLIVKVVYITKNNRILTRRCIPFDYGPSRSFKDKSQRYHFLDIDSPNGKHIVSILPSQVLKIEITDINFDPSKYIHWKPKWFLKRNWGVYS